MQLTTQKRKCWRRERQIAGGGGQQQQTRRAYKEQVRIHGRLQSSRACYDFHLHASLRRQFLLASSPTNPSLSDIIGFRPEESKVSLYIFNVSKWLPDPCDELTRTDTAAQHKSHPKLEGNHLKEYNSCDECQRPSIDRVHLCHLPLCKYKPI